MGRCLGVYEHVPGGGRDGCCTLFFRHHTVVEPRKIDVISIQESVSPGILLSMEMHCSIPQKGYDRTARAETFD